MVPPLVQGFVCPASDQDIERQALIGHCPDEPYGLRAIGCARVIGANQDIQRLKRQNLPSHGLEAADRNVF